MLLGAGILRSGRRTVASGGGSGLEPLPPGPVHRSSAPRSPPSRRQTERLDDTRAPGDATISCSDESGHWCSRTAGRCLQSHCGAGWSRREGTRAFRGCLLWAESTWGRMTKASTGPALRPGSSPGARVGRCGQVLRGRTERSEIGMASAPGERES